MTPAEVKARVIIGIDQAMRITSLSRSTIGRMVKAGTFPPPRGRGRLRKWWLDEVEAWCADFMATAHTPSAPVPTSSAPANDSPPTT